MSFVVSARKYRPQTFESVLGQEHVTSTLKNALMTDKLAHAFLFCGPRGVGKTTCARLLAKVINMDDPKQALADGSYAQTDIDISFNIFELDAASNNKVEDIRYLIEQVRFAPQRGQYKVFIIDEVHMLSTAAFNAFLKILEEPPAYAVFILATTEKHKILPTILSRCQIYDFKRIGVKDIIRQLQIIAEKEGIPTEEDGLLIIAEKADGAMRDALSLFDRISSASDNALTYDSVISILNVLDYEHFFKAVDYIITEDGSAMLLLLDEVLARGFDADMFMRGLATHLRNLLYCKQDITVKLLEVSERLTQRYKTQSETIEYGTILSCLHLLNEADIHFNRAKDTRLHAEIALLKICYTRRMVLSSPHEEKKTADLNEESDNSSSLTATTAQSIINTPSLTTSANKDSAAAVHIPSVTQEPIIPSDLTRTTPITQVSDATPPPAASNLGKANIVEKTSALSSSLDELIKSAEQKLASTKSETKPLDIDVIHTLWQEYTTTVESITTKGILENVVTEIVNDGLSIFVPTTVAKEELHQEIDLFSKIRNHFGRHDMQIMVKVDRDKFPDFHIELPKKLYSAKEKYDYLVNKNPVLLDLIQALDLKLDNG